MADDAGQPLSLRDRIRQLEQAANSPLQQPPAALAPSSSSSPPPRPASSASQATRTAATGSRDVQNEGDKGRRAGGATRRTPSPSPPRPQFAQLRALYNQSSTPSSSPAKGLKTESVKADPLSAAEAPVKAVEVPQAGASTAVASGAPALPAKPRPLWAHEKHRVEGAAASEAQLGLRDPKDARKDQEVSKEGSTGPTVSKRSPAPPPSRPRSVQTMEMSQSATSSGPTSSTSPTRSPSSPQRLATLANASPSLAPQLPPRRSSTLDTLRPPNAGSTSPALPPRPSQSTVTSPSPSLPAKRPNPPPRPGWIAPRSSASPASTRTSSPTPPAPSGSQPSSSTRPPLPTKPASQNPLSAPLAPASPSPVLPSRQSTLPSSSPSPTPSRNPATARRRYDRVFDACIEGKENGERVGAEVVREVWRRSRLEEEVLRRIWEDVHPSQPSSSDPSPSLDRSSFARGMWLIDEELRRRKSQRQQSSMRV